MRNRKQVNYAYDDYDEQFRRVLRESRETASERDDTRAGAGGGGAGSRSGGGVVAVGASAAGDGDMGRASRKRSR